MAAAAAAEARRRERPLHPEALDAFLLGSVPPAVEVFFRTNRRVCEEWLGRIRPLLSGAEA